MNWCQTVSLALVVGCASRPPARPVAEPPLARAETAAAESPATGISGWAALVSAPDRSEADRALDVARRPAEMLAFFGVRARDRVAELAAGGGYTTELLARAVGPEGIVFGHNTPFVLERFAARPWSARLAKPVMKNVVRLDRSLEDPFPPDAHNLDLVVMVLFYHDTYWFETDRVAMNAAVFRALKPGGTFVVIDHSARPGSGSTEAKTLHRVEETLVRQEIENAGLILDGTSNFLRNPDDTRDWIVFDKSRRGSTDRFALKFRKPTR